MDNNSSVIVDNKSEFILKTGSIMEIGSEASFIVRNGSKFIVEPGAQIIVNGKILIDGITSEMHYAASNIHLNDIYSIIEINKGKLIVAQNTDFTFTGNGFMRFSCGNDYSVVGDLGSRFIINGTGKNNKKIEVLEGTLKMILEHSHPYLSKGFPITITNAGVHLAEGAKILANVWLNLQNTKFTSTTGAKNNHGGLHVSVDENHIINNVTFEYGQYGMYSVLHANHVHSNYAEKINISNCSFSNNTTGLVTVGQGANLENVQFINNSLKGWSAEGMTMPSDFKNSSVQNSPIGISYSAGTTADLFINTSSVINSTNTGILFLGHALLSLKCSNINSVNNNSSKGIFLGDRASINMSPSFFPSSGRSIVSGNTSIQGGQYALVEEELSVGRLNLIGAANELFLDQGRNDIKPKTSQGKAISGQFYYNSCPEGSILANRNRWNIGNTSPVYSVDYNITSPACKNTIYIIDNNPGNLPCPLVATPSPASAFFYRANEIAEANQGGPNTIFKKFERGLKNLENSDYLSAFNEFESVLLTNVPNPTPLAKKVIELSYQYMHLAVGKSYSEGIINNSGAGVNQYILRLIAIEDNKINKAILDSDIAIEYLGKMDKAKTLVLADKRTDALPIFYGNYNIADSTNFIELDKWICVVSLEQDLIDENIELNDFAEALNTCQTQSLASNRIMNNNNDNKEMAYVPGRFSKSPNTTEINSITSNKATSSNIDGLTKKPNFRIFPNPTSGKFTIVATSIDNVKIYDVLGNLINEFGFNSNSQIEVDLTGRAQGIYVVIVTGENYIEIKKLIYH
ncbi:MAG: T9SS type A sorting domain-containing protein, partial [Bacteroidota bacterium]|nr:T9SS type A sorting domain-containing protein [Bacteroidota bacterium]